MVTMKNIFLWGVMLYDSMDCLKRFEGHLYFHLQDTRQMSVEKVCYTISSLIVQMMVTMKNIFLWGVMLYDFMDCLKRFERHLYFHLQNTRQTSIEKVCYTISSLIVQMMATMKNIFL